MLETLQNEDRELDFIGVTKHEIIETLTLDDVQIFLESLGVDQIEVNTEKEYVICPTICHNPLHEAHSMKLYWYQNYKLFHCYTECNENMSIFRLYQKFIKVNEDRDVSDEEAQDYVQKCLKHIVAATPIKKHSSLGLDLNNYKYNTHIPQLNEYSNNVLSCFIKHYPWQWLQEGITKEAMDKFKISFSISQNKIVIPHYDIKGRLIGIRARTLDREEATQFGKYRPIQIGTTVYSHPLQFNLYGIYEHQEAIRKRKSAVIVEGEKSVLLDQGYYGKWSNAVACCGSTINKYHISLLTDILGVNEIIIAFDKEYIDCYSEKAKQYRHKLENICQKYKNKATFSYIWDYNNLLNEKDSPLDKGKEVYEKLLQERAKVK